jgi:hypothetical protein
MNSQLCHFALYYALELLIHVCIAWRKFGTLVTFDLHLYLFKFITVGKLVLGSLLHLQIPFALLGKFHSSPET